MSRTMFVVEKQPRWGPECKRQFAGSGITVQAATNLAAIGPRLAQSPGSVLLLSFANSVADGLRDLAWLAAARVSTQLVVIAAASAADLEWPVRELGAANFFVAPVPGRILTGICRRLLAPPPHLPPVPRSAPNLAAWPTELVRATELLPDSPD